MLLTVGEQLLRVNQALPCQGGIEVRRPLTLTKNKAIAIGVIGLGWIEVEHLAVEDGQNIHTGQVRVQVGGP